MLPRLKKLVKTTFKVTVSDGDATRTEAIDLLVTSYTPGPCGYFAATVKWFYVERCRGQ